MALMDVIIGGVILGIGLTVLMSITGRSLALQNDGERQLVAAWLADELLNMVLVEGPVTYPRVHDTSGRFDDPFGDYAFDVSIEDQGLEQPYRVTATVRWRYGREDRQVQVQTLINAPEAPPDSRMPYEPVDRLERWYGDDTETK